MIKTESNQVVIFGAGRIAELVHFYLTHDSEFEIAGFVVDDEYLSSRRFCGLPTVSASKASLNFPPQAFSMFVALSYTDMNSVRTEKCEWARACGYRLISYVSSRATTFHDLTHGDNCLILEENTIQPFVTLGNNVFLWSGNHIGHHSVIENNVFAASHCGISGNCQIGANSFLGVNCTIQDGLKIGPSCFVGPQALVRKDLAAESVLISAPTSIHRLSSRNLSI